MKKLYGEAAPEKMLFHHFEEQRQRWSAKMKAAGSLAEKASKLTELRDAEGCFSRCSYDAQTGLCIEEYHHTMTPIYEEYPNAVRMEVQMMEQLLGSRVVRKIMEGGKGRRMVVYEVASLGMPNGSERMAVQGGEQRSGASMSGASNKAPTFLEM